MATENLPATRDDTAILEKVIVQGDLAQLPSADRVVYYSRVCESLGLNPFTRPFEYIVLNDKLTLYAKRDATDQIRNSRNISVSIVSRETIEGVYVVTARATAPDGRTDESIGAVPLAKEVGAWETSQNGKRYFKKNGQMIPLRGDDLANALMKAETKAKRRVTLSIAGLGWLDETEIETIPSARPAPVSAEVVDTRTGEIVTIPRRNQPSAADLPPEAEIAAADVVDASDAPSAPIGDESKRQELIDALKELAPRKWKSGVEGLRRWWGSYYPKPWRQPTWKRCSLPISSWRRKVNGRTGEWH
jgi:hypothetical protein